MIVKNEGKNKPLIYDWDRAYIKGIKNDYLNSDPCEINTLCYHSQCNIFFKDRPIDFFKILYTFYHNLNSKETFYFILKTMGVELAKSQKIGAYLESHGPYLSGEKCSILYSKGYDPVFEKLLAEQFGDWGNIMKKIRNPIL